MTAVGHSRQVKRCDGRQARPLGQAYVIGMRALYSAFLPTICAVGLRYAGMRRHTVVYTGRPSTPAGRRKTSRGKPISKPPAGRQKTAASLPYYVNRNDPRQGRERPKTLILRGFRRLWRVDIMHLIGSKCGEKPPGVCPPAAARRTRKNCRQNLKTRTRFRRR